MFNLLKSLSKKQFFMALLAISFIVLQVFLDLKMPEFMAAITRLVATPNSLMADILRNGGYMLLCAVGSMLASMITSFLATGVATGFSKTLRERLFKKVMLFGSEEMSKFSTSSLITRTTNDITQVQMLLAMSLQMLIRSPVMLVWAIAKVSSKQWQWSFATALAVTIILLVATIIIVFALPKFKRIQKLTDSLNRVTNENLTGIRVVRAYNAEDYQENKFENVSEDLKKTNLFANRITALLQPTMNFVVASISLVIYWIGAYLINQAAINVKIGIFSDMIVFSSYAIQVIFSFAMLTMLTIMLPPTFVSVGRINEVLKSDIAIKSGDFSGDTDIKGEVEFRDVSFGYPDASDNVINNINFKVSKGETLAIIGSTGSGKSSVINLIPRFYEATSGEVLIDGINVKEYSLKSLREKIGFVPQRAVLFSGTVESNVEYGSANKNVDEALEIAQAKDFVSEMENGVQSNISRGGTNVSGGQKQRLSIARAINKHPEIYVFDDTFSALDYKTDRALREALETKLGNSSRIIVAQRISTIKNADKILVLDQGNQVGLGKHEDLLKNCPVYREIASFQLTEEELSRA